jgi:hypothetical protein
MKIVKTILHNKIEDEFLWIIYLFTLKEKFPKASIQI